MPVPSAPTVIGITPSTGPVDGGTSVVITGSGFNTFGAFQVGLGSVGNWFSMTDLLVVDDNTLTATTVLTTDGAGVYQVGVWFNAADSVVLANAFTYT